VALWDRLLCIFTEASDTAGEASVSGRAATGPALALSGPDRPIGIFFDDAFQNASMTLGDFSLSDFSLSCLRWSGVAHLPTFLTQ